MKLNFLGRMLCAATLSFGLVLSSCEDGFLGNDEDTEQGENGGAEGDSGQTDSQKPLTLDLKSYTATTAVFTGTADLDRLGNYSEFGIALSYDEEFGNDDDYVLRITSLSDGNKYTKTATGLLCGKKIYYTTYLCKVGVYLYGEVKSFDMPANLSLDATANCYIVSKGGFYGFKTVKGNSATSVGTVTSAEILWESFGTSTTPKVGDLIKSVSYNGGYIAFQTADAFKEGNAVIAAKDASGNILWSWHIWLTDQPQGQKYYNNAGTMMDRNLGATSATPGDVGALGLLYQWGRKDPFLGSSSISSSTFAKSTITWPSTVPSNSSNGTIAYATANPTTFIKVNNSNYDWYYTGSDETDNTRWTTSESNKSIYDPCPAGWRVPDGGTKGVWSKALGSSSSFTQSSLYDSTNEGINFSGKFGSASTIWYPASGCRGNGDGGLGDVGSRGNYCSASPNSSDAYSLSFSSNGGVFPSYDYNRVRGQSVRCLQE